MPTALPSRRRTPRLCWVRKGLPQPPYFATGRTRNLAREARADGGADEVTCSTKEQVEGQGFTAFVYQYEGGEGFAALEIVPGTNNLTPNFLERRRRGESVTYFCEATSPEGFVQQLAVSYVGQGYWFYVTGSVPEGKDPLAVDRKLIERYGIDISKWARARRKRAGVAHVQYLRYRRFFVLLSTKGEHRFFEEEKAFKDVRRDSIRFDGYSIGYKRDPKGKWHPSVRIHPDTYRGLRAYFLGAAARKSISSLSDELWALPFEPYAPVRTQLLCLLRAVNAERKRASLPPVPSGVVRLRRRPTVVFSRNAPPPASEERSYADAEVIGVS